MATFDKSLISKFKMPETTLCIWFEGAYDHASTPLPLGVTLQDGTLTITKHTQLTQPLHLVCLAMQAAPYPIRIISESYSCATIIEELVNLSSADSAQFAITLETQEHSTLNYYQSPCRATPSHYTVIRSCTQHHHSVLNSGFLGGPQGAKVTERTEVTLAGESARYQALGLIALKDQDQLHYRLRISHLAPECFSNVFFKGLVADMARGSFECRVVVQADAPRTQTTVTNRNLLLNQGAEMQSAPELEIYNDDVACTHGATVGQLDQDAIFYLRSRGIPEEVATKLLTAAFAEEIGSKFIPQLQTQVESLVNHVS